MKPHAAVVIVVAALAAGCGRQVELCQPTDLWVNKKAIMVAGRAAIPYTIPHRMWVCPDGNEWRDW